MSIMIVISAKWAKGTFHDNIFIRPTFRLSNLHKNCQVAKLFSLRVFSNDTRIWVTSVHETIKTDSKFQAKTVRWEVCSN